MKSVMFYDIMIRGRNISTELYPGSFRAFEAQTSYCLFKKKGMSHNHDQTGCLQCSCELNKNHLNNLFFWGGGANSLVISVGYPISTLFLHMVTYNICKLLRSPFIIPTHLYSHYKRIC